jgi:hypothetical protein
MAYREIKRRYNVRLFDETAGQLRRIGHGNLTKGIEIAAARDLGNNEDDTGIVAELGERDMLRAPIMTKLARMILLMRWQDAGRLDNMTQGDIVLILNDRPSRSSISRALEEIVILRKIIEEMDYLKQWA